jgi:predicted phage terminase large subunit-like protein
MKRSCSTPVTKNLANAIYRNDFYSFIRGVFPMVSTSGQFLPNWHIEAMAHALNQVRLGKQTRLIITVPPRYLKSICATVAFPAYLLGHDPTSRIICVSYSDALARSHANDFRAIVGSDKYRDIFPGMLVSPAKDTETEVKTTARGFRYATSVGGTLTGRGGNVLIIDDPQKPQDAHSATARANLEQWYFNTLYPRLDSKRDDAIIVVMQRLHVDDLVGKLLDHGNWVHLNLAAIAQEDHVVEIGHGRVHHRQIGDVLHPEREPLASLEETKRGMGSLDFAAQYLQAPVPPEGNLIRWRWFNYYDEPPHKVANDEITISWDTALSSKDLSSYSVGMVIQVRRGRFFLLEVIREQLEYPDLRRKVMQVYERWRYACNRCNLLIENKGSGMSLIQDLRQYGIGAIAMDPIGDKVMRMAAQAAKIEAGMVYLPRKASWLTEFQREIMGFPRGNTDDQVDALSQALAYDSRPRAGWGVVKGLY